MARVYVRIPHWNCRVVASRTVNAQNIFHLRHSVYVRVSHIELYFSQEGEVGDAIHTHTRVLELHIGFEKESLNTLVLAFYAGGRLLIGPDGSILPRANVLESGIGMSLGHAYRYTISY